MKKLITLIFILAMFTTFHSIAHSQNIRLNGYSLYTLDDDIESTNGISYFRGTVKAGLLWGAGLEFNPIPDYGIEVAYFREDTDVPSKYYFGVGIDETRTFKLGANYIMLGGTRYLRIPRSPIEPYAGMMVGMAILENKEPLVGAQTSATKFAWQLKAGVNIMASKNVGIKLQMQLLSAVQSVGGGLYLGTGGVNAGVGTYSTMLQFGMGGGLVFRFGR
jgi:opacity protein-like surface antigen